MAPPRSLRLCARRALLCAPLLALFCAGGCAAGEGGGPLDFPGGGEGGKSDAFGRGLVGVAAPYRADPSLEDPETVRALREDVRLRRQVAWATAKKVLEPVPLLGVAELDEGEEEVSWPAEDVPRVPRFQTWYGVDDFKRIFQHLYRELGEAGRRAREPLSAEAIASALVWNAGAAERSDRWPLERYLRHVRDLAGCPEGLSEEACRRLVQSRLGGASSGTSRILYSPATITHLLENYGQVEACLAELDELSLTEAPSDPENFTACFQGEFPPDAVLVKAQWVRADFGRDLPAYDTGAEAMRDRLDGTAHWGEAGDRRADPGAEDIYTIRLRGGSVYRLAGLHIMTKELRHWQWVTLWWSDDPDRDFGADRPRAIAGELPGVWSNYKMCAVTWFDEEDPELAKRYRDLPTLAGALEAVGGAAGEPSWCSNPYLEHGRNNARTNCIGCHQHGGATVAHDRDGDGALDPIDLERVIRDEVRYPNAGRSQIRELFPADYLYSFNRVDDLAGVIEQEIEFYEHADRAKVQARIDAILAESGEADPGAELFSASCAACHGAEGQGSGFAPDLGERVPGRSDASLIQTLLQGRGAMPAWGERFDNREIASLLAHLRRSFGGS